MDTLVTKVNYNHKLILQYNENIMVLLKLYPSDIFVFLDSVVWPKSCKSCCKREFDDTIWTKERVDYETHKDETEIQPYSDNSNW